MKYSRKAFLGFVAVSLMLAISAAIIYQNYLISNKARVNAINLGVYWDPEGTNKVTEIDWELFDPGQSKDTLVYVKNEGNAEMTLTLSTQDWDPSESTNYMTLSWNYTGSKIQVDEVIPVTLTLSVASNVAGIGDFTFTIVITGEG